MFYQWMSSTTNHAGLESIARFVHAADGVLHLRVNPEPATSANLSVIMSAHVADLAVDVFKAFEQSPDAIIELHICRPRQAEWDKGDDALDEGRQPTDS